MTAAEHIVMWIESSQPHYKRLLKLSVPGNHLSDYSRSLDALRLANDALREMLYGGDAWRSDHDEKSLLSAAIALIEWRLEA